MCFECSRVQQLHKPMTGFGATPHTGSCRPRVRRGFTQHSLGEGEVGIHAGDTFSTVKIAHFPRPARNLESDLCGDSRPRLSVERSSTGCDST